MKAALVKSAKDAQIRDSFNKESFAIISNDSILQFIKELNRLEHALPRNASKLHTVLVRPTEAVDPVFILNFEVLETASMSWDGSTRHLDQYAESINLDTRNADLNESKVKEGDEDND